MINIFNNIIQQKPSESVLNDNDIFIFDNISYPIKDIIKLTKILPIKTYHIDLLSPILKKSSINFDFSNILSIAEYLDGLLVNDPIINYIILLEIDDNHHKYIYGYEYFIKQYLKHVKKYDVKIINTKMLQTLYMKLRKTYFNPIPN